MLNRRGFLLSAVTICAANAASLNAVAASVKAAAATEFRDDGLVVYTFPISGSPEVVTPRHPIVSLLRATDECLVEDLIYDVRVIWTDGVTIHRQWLTIPRQIRCPLRLRQGDSVQITWPLNGEIPFVVDDLSTLSVHTRQDGVHLYPRLIEA